MTTDPTTTPTAADALLGTPGVNVRPDVVAEAHKMGEWLRSMGLLSTEPAEALRPFSRRSPRVEADADRGVSLTERPATRRRG